MSMTVGKLHKLLGELVNNGHSRKPVCVSKDTFKDNRESDGVTILDVFSLNLACIEMADDDGGMAYNKNGVGKTRRVVVLGGCATEATP